MRGLPLLADHFSAILYLLASLYWIWDSPKMLPTVQTVALALGALPVYALTRRRLVSAPIALLLAIVYLLYPAIEWANTFDFHPETLATPMLLAALNYLSTRNWKWYFIMAVLTALTKETAGLAIILLGCYVLLLKQSRTGWLPIGFGAVSLAVALATIRYFNYGASSPYWLLYAPFGNSITSLAVNTTHHPCEIVSRLNTDAILQNPSYGIVAIGRYTILLRRGADHHDGLRLLEQRSSRRSKKGNDAGKAYPQRAEDRRDGAF